MGVRKIEQIVSRYNPVFDVPNLKLGYGRDKNIYLVVGGSPDGRLLRLAPDGTHQRFTRAGAAALLATADAAGVIAIAEHHFQHRVVFYDKELNELGHYDDFAGDDTLGYTSPSGLEAAESGVFYVLDQHRRRVLRLLPDGTLDQEIPLTGLPAEAVSAGGAVGLRVAEHAGRIYTAWPKKDSPEGFVCASDLAGRCLWSDQVKVSGDLYGGFDTTEDGDLHVILKGTGRQPLRIYQPDGQKTDGAIGLPGDGYEVQHLRLREGRYYVKRNDPRYLFEVYDTAGGTDATRVEADVERLTVEYDSDVWTAGRPMPLTVTHTPGRWPNRPRFRVWLRPFGVPEFTELPLTGGAVTPPADARGLYQVRVSPDVAGQLSEYVVDGTVEIRPAGTVQGSLSLMSCRIDKDEHGDPLPPVNVNRLHYGRGEAVTVAVRARVGPGVPLPTAVRAVLTRDGAVLREWKVDLDGTGGGRLDIDAEYTGTLEPGRYAVDAEPPTGLTFTVAPQYLDIGPGLTRRPDFHLTLYTDIYAPNHACFPVDPRARATNPVSTALPGYADLPDLVQAHLNRVRALGLNLAVDRLGASGWPATFETDNAADTGTDLAGRLAASPVAVHPLKAGLEDVGRRVIAGYGAHGIEEQAVLHINDTFLPLDWPGNYENRTLPALKRDLTRVTGRLGVYAAFRGWTWGANWWNGPVGVADASGAQEKQEFTDAVNAIDHGGRTWAPVLDTVTDRTVGRKPAEAAEFRETLNTVAPGLSSALTRPYYAVQTPPAPLFAEADEVDLHYQGEQIQIPLATAHMVDFLRRPGKPVWGHPELTNDDGTGGMILPTLFQQMLRGPDGTGLVPDEGVRQTEGVAAYAERTGGNGPKRGEPRSGGAGKTSVQRAAFDLIGRLGPAVAGAESANRVAIVVSTRMQRLERFDGWTLSRYFARLYEAYSACLYAGRPASFVHSEDVTADVLRGYQVVLLVGQRVDPEPRLAEALKAVHADPPAPAGKVTVYADATCHTGIAADFHPLGIGFDHVQPLLERTVQNDDTAYFRLRKVFLAQGAALAEVLHAVPPVAECDNPEVLLSEWTAGDTTYIWAVNNTMPDWEPGTAWRVGLLCAQRLPVRAKLTVRLPALHQVVDVLTGKPVSLLGGTFTADLRTVPARLYAIVPLLHTPLPTASEDGFGPHVRDIAVAADGRTAALNTFNWDHNLYGLDLATGRTRWRRRLGHHFA